MKTILILEDDVIFSRSIGNWLKKKGMATEHATTLSAARKALSAREFDLVLADLRLPDGNSTSLLEWMNEKTPKICAPVKGRREKRKRTYAKTTRPREAKYRNDPKICEKTASKKSPARPRTPKKDKNNKKPVNRIKSETASYKSGDGFETVCVFDDEAAASAFFTRDCFL
jgi:DNA-binding NtrC family response regulator